jgi:hypothetical protein
MPPALPVQRHPLTRSPAHPLTASLTPATCEALLTAAIRRPTYLDRFYSVHPGQIKGAKRLVVVLPSESEHSRDAQWLDKISDYASIVFQHRRPVAHPSAVSHA